jgi:hypothetical protein
MPSSPEIAQERLRGMRGKRSVVGDKLHALGVQLGINYGRSFFYPSEDRSILECVIIPYYQLSNEHQQVAFIGTDWYTHGYTRLFARKSYTTMDPNADQARYGARRHIVDGVAHLDRHFAPDWLDLVMLNGVIGWGLNEREEAETAFAAIHKCLRDGGHLMVGWNDLQEHRPFRLEEIKSLSQFKQLTFPPLSTSEYLVANEWRHTFTFFVK